MLEYRYGADVVLHHQPRDFEHGLVDLNRYENLILEQIRDQHLYLLGVCAGKRRARQIASDS
jgi:hypothetical protein